MVKGCAWAGEVTKRTIVYFSGQVRGTFVTIDKKKPAGPIIKTEKITHLSAIKLMQFSNRTLPDNTERKFKNGKVLEFRKSCSIHIFRVTDRGGFLKVVRLDRL